MARTSYPTDAKQKLDDFAIALRQSKNGDFNATKQRHGLMPRLESGIFDGDEGGFVPPSAIATRVEFEWRANGPFQVGTEVDGQIRIPFAFTIDSVVLYRKTAGSSGSTIVDLNLNGATLYTTAGNRPTVTAAAGNNQQSAGTLPDSVAVAAGGVLSIDIDQIEGGTPSDFVLIVGGS